MQRFFWRIAYVGLFFAFYPFLSFIFGNMNVHSFSQMDIVIPVKGSILDLVIERTIPHIIQHMRFRSLYVMIKNDINYIHRLRSAFGDKIIILDEDQIASGLTFDAVATEVQGGKSSRSPGWYFQQFLKLSMAMREDISPNYIVWDADAIMLRPIHFLNKKGQVLVSPTREYYPPYFHLFDRLFGIEKQVTFSFITEHMVFNKAYVQEMVAHLSKHTDEKENGLSWWKWILYLIHQQKQGDFDFSEYEFYGNYVSYHYPQHFVKRKLIRYRSGKKILGNIPTKAELSFASIGFDYVSIEEVDQPPKSVYWRRVLLLLMTMKGGIDRIYFTIARSLNSNR